VRKAWKDLTPAYRARLERRGVTSHTHAVANLTQARGHPSKPPAGAAPRDIVERVVKGQGTESDWKALRKRGSFIRPAWVPKSTSLDVAAALSQLPPPSRWEDVEFVPRSDGDAWTMIVKLKGNAYDREILIPGGGDPGSGAREVLEIVAGLRRKQEDDATKKRKRAEALFYEVLGTDEEAA